MPEVSDLEETEEEKEIEEAKEEIEEAPGELEEEKLPEEKPKLRKKRNKAKRYELYEAIGGELKRLRSSCPRCGPGIFMADHSDRFACGKCGYTEFKE